MWSGGSIPDLTEEPMNKRFYKNWDKRIAQYNAQREREEAAIAKARGAVKPAPAPKAQPATDLDMSELQKRLKF